MEILIRLDVTDEKFSKKIFEHLESIESISEDKKVYQGDSVSSGILRTEGISHTSR